MSTRYYLASNAGQACGPGTRYSLLEDAVFTSSSEVSVNTEQTWNVLEGRAFINGLWVVDLQVAVGTGGGPQSRVGLVLERRNSACGVVEQILSFESGSLTAGATNTVVSNVVGTTLEFSAGDILLLRVVRTNGSRNISVVHNTTSSYVQGANPVYVGGTRIKTWNGTMWVEGELKRWDGSAWGIARAKLWNGTSWVDT
jgi:hypothetical protein